MEFREKVTPKKKNLAETGSLCSRIWVWLVVLLMAVILVAFGTWTIVSYQRALSDLQSRLYALETQYLNLDGVIEDKVNFLVDKVSILSAK